MSKLIDKSALVAEIERRIEETKGMQPKFDQFWAGNISAFKGVLKILNTLEVKEVDLNFQRFAKEMETVFALPSSETENTEEEPLNWEYAIAKHFFELGIRSTITEEDCKLIWNIGDDLPYMPEEDFFKELLKRYKTQKGE